MSLESAISEFSSKLGEFIDQMMDDPNMGMIKSIKEAREDDRNHELIILLNIFFESLISTSLEERWEDKDLSEREEDWLDKDYYYKLRLAKDIDLLEDSEFQLLDFLRKSRNFYAHNIQALHPDEKSFIEEQDKLEEVYQLYQNVPIGKTLTLE